MEKTINGTVAKNEYIITYYGYKDCHGVSMSGSETYPSDEKAIESVKEYLEKSNLEIEGLWQSAKVEKRNGYWPANGGLFCGTDDEIFRMNYEPKKDDDSPRKFYKLTAWRSGLSQDCKFEEVILRPSETHFEGGLRYDKDHNRVYTLSEKWEAESYCACD